MLESKPTEPRIPVAVILIDSEESAPYNGRFVRVLCKMFFLYLLCVHCMFAIHYSTYSKMAASLRENIILNSAFKNEATRANLQVNKRILKWRQFRSNVYFQCNSAKTSGV